MNRIWSENIQGIQTLWLSRRLRFADCFFSQYDALFRLDRNAPLRILEIGCGPGALAQALHRWYPQAQIVGIDRDTAFIEYARVHVPGVEFCEGDATALPFADGSFDVTISNTVCEHVQTDAFFAEQRRVLQQGGICLVLSARKGFVHRAECLAPLAAETEFWSRIPEENLLERYAVGRYAMTEQQLPQAMECGGFSGVSTGYAVVNLTPDDPGYDAEMAEEIINTDRYSDVEAVLSTRAPEAQAVAAEIHAKYDRRIALYRSGIRQWDTETSITMVVRGEKGIDHGTQF